MTLTAAGMILLRHADAIAARLASVQADLSALAQGAIGTLRVGCYQSVRILPRVLRAFAAAWLIAGPFTHLELLDDPYVVVAREDSDVRRDGRPVRLRDLADLPLVTYARMREVHEQLDASALATPHRLERAITRCRGERCRCG